MSYDDRFRIRICTGKYIAADPGAGEEKKGELVGVRVYKFRVHDQQLLLVYEHDENSILLLAIGVHENFYRDLKKSHTADAPTLCTREKLTGFLLSMAPAP